MRLLFGIACCLYWSILIESTYPSPASLLRMKQAYAAKLAYKDNEATSNEFAMDADHQPKLVKSRISDFTDPDTGLNPYLDLSEGPTGVRPKYYKYDRHSKRDNAGPNEDDPPVYGRLRMMEKNPLAFGHRAVTNEDKEEWDMEAKDEPATIPNRFQRVAEEEPQPREPAKTDRSLTRGFVSVVEGESGGRRNFWMTSSRPKTTPEVTTTPQTTVTPILQTTISTTVNPTDYVTINTIDGKELSSIPKGTIKPRGNMLEVESRAKANSELEDGQSFPEEDPNDSRPPIATFLDTKSFVYSLALICASVVFFAAVLTGMFIYRRKRRRLPGVHKKGGRFFFKTGAKNRMAPISRQQEERILPDDFRVTVC